MKSIFLTNVKRIFIDTSAWVELTLSQEKYFKPVSSYFIKELKGGSSFFTSDYVLDEAWTRLITHQSFSSTKALREKTKEAERQRQLAIIYIDEILFEESWRLFAKYSDHKLSFTDATSVAIIQQLKLDEILTLNRGFAKIGLTVQPRLK